jgi:hypothetical protein
LTISMPLARYRISVSKSAELLRDIETDSDIARKAGWVLRDQSPNHGNARRAAWRYLRISRSRNGAAVGD